MIKTFADEDTYALFLGKRPRRLPSGDGFVRTANRKLYMVHLAAALADLKNPPGNKLHPLEKDRAGQHAIRINDQFRVCFTWRDGDAYDVQVTDYH